MKNKAYISPKIMYRTNVILRYKTGLLGSGHDIKIWAK